ncbi:hypothetical protein J437_LFUL019047, partial [Ladona fulva]
MSVLTFEEKSLKPHLDYRAKPDLIVGFEDHGFLGRSWRYAKYALVFMVRGLLQQPIAVFIISSPTKSEVLTTLMEEVLWHCHKADHGSHHRKTLDEGQEIVTIFNPPHLLKSTRNLLQKHDIKLQVDMGILQFEGTASWQDIHKAYMSDKEQMQAFRSLPKLTDMHVNPK